MSAVISLMLAVEGSTSGRFLSHRVEAAHESGDDETTDVMRL